MKKLLAIGEALIDFIPNQVDTPLKDVESFKGVVGGAPANVCAVYSILGGESLMLTQLGEDAFGDKIIEKLRGAGVGTSFIRRTDAANTALAFVSLSDGGGREFSFYRKPSADMLLSPDEIKKEYFKDAFALHFCSISLCGCPMKRAHEAALSYAIDQGVIVSFDPNLRRPLWNDAAALKKAIWEFIPSAHVLKISDDEIEFITGESTMEAANEKLFTGNVRLIVYTKGADGAEAFTKSTHASSPGKAVKAIDTTGAGDAFIGSFLYMLAKKGVTPSALAGLTEAGLKEAMDFSNAYSAISVRSKGAIDSYVTYTEAINNI